jgi:hypothetical protein
MTLGGTKKILDGTGTLSIDFKGGKLEGSFIEGGQTVLFDSVFKISGKNIAFEAIGIYGESGFGTTNAQNLTNPATYMKIKTEIEKIVKSAGFESGTMKYIRLRPDGSPLPDSPPRIIPLKLK